MSFWVNYIILKEKLGQNRDAILKQIEDKYGLEKRQEVEQELSEFYD